MALLELMSWSKADKRWHKGCKGRRYAVSPKQLDCPPSREHSRESANTWWLAKQDELATLAPPKPNERQYKRAIDIRKRMAQWFREHATPHDPLMGAELAEQTKSQYQDAMAHQEAEANRLENILSNEDNPPPLTREDEPMYGISEQGRAVWHDRFAHDAKDPAPKERSIGYWVERWVESQRARANAKEITSDRYSMYRYALEYFPTFAGNDNDIEGITTDLVEAYYHHLLDLIAKRDNDPKAGCSRSYAKARLDACKQFCQWLDERDMITLPKILRNRKALKITLGDGKRKTYPIADIQAILADAKTSERMKLWVLLMLNTGAYQVDIAKLTLAQVNMNKGRIERKRSKTKGYVNVPLVNYKLWGKTKALLAKYLNTDKTNPLALLNEDGGALQRKYIGADGKAKKVCNITSAYKRLARRLGLTHSLGSLRKTSADLLFNSKTYRPLHVQFLGHSPRSIAEKFYVDANATTLDNAIRWLGTQYELK